MSAAPIPVRRRVWLRWLACGVVWVCAGGVRAAEVSVEMEGLDDPLEAAVRNTLTLSRYADREVSAPQLRRLMSRADAEIRRALEPFGYYDPQIESEVTRDDDGDFLSRFEIDLGEPVIVRRVRVAVQGPARDDAAIREEIERFAPSEGQPLVHRVYEQHKAAIQSELRSQGYLGAKTLESSVQVVAGVHSAEIDLVWDSGERHRFGEVRFSETQFPDDFLQRYLPWSHDAYYSAEALLHLQQRLVASGYFGAVSVQPDLEHAQNGRVPVDVVLVPDERSVYTAGLFVSTDVGPGGRLGVERRWVNDYGHKLGGEVGYASNRQDATISYRIPSASPEERELSFGASYTDETTDTSESETARIAAVDTLAHWYGFTRTLGLQFLTGDFEIADQTGSSSILFAEASLSRTSSDDPLFPRRGYSVSAGVRATPGAWLSDTAFIQARSSGRWVRALGARSRLLLRAELGAMSVGDFDQLPPELRFFAGGDRSVRGFDFEEIGETDDAGGVVGGEYLATAGIEVEHYPLERWGAALFVDAGDAFRSRFQVNVGAGAGLRWRSPIGVIRLDVAKPIVTDFDRGWRVHLVIGPDL